jgi:two-component system NtrC family sensor kinase
MINQPASAFSALGPFFDAVGAPIMVFVGEHPVYANEAMQRLLGYSLDDLRRQSYAVWGEEANQQRMQQYLARCRGSDELPPVVDVELLTGTGAQRHIELTGRRYATAEATYVVLSASDLSDMRHVQQMLLDTQQELECLVRQRTIELQVTHDELEAFLENVSVGIVCTSAYRVTRGNRKFFDMFELGETLPDDFSLHRLFCTGDDGQQLLDHARSTFSAGRSLFHEMNLQTLGGRRLWVQMIAYASDPDQPEDGVWWLLQDRTEVMRAQEELVNNYRRLQTSNQQLKQTQAQLLHSGKMASVSQLAAGMAHEINNPVAFVASNVRSLQRSVPTLLELLQAYQAHTAGALAGRADPVALQAVRTLERHADVEFLSHDMPKLLAESDQGLKRVHDIVEQLKTFSRVDHADWQDADLHQALDLTLNVLGHEVRSKAEIQREWGVLPRVRCLLASINQVFLNLITNALHAIEQGSQDAASPKGKVTITTQTEAQAGRDYVWIEVADNGCGMSADTRQRVFDPFFTTHAVGRGLGLGLTVCFDVIKKHDGHIDVWSQPGEGSRFRVWLPVLGPQQA